VVDDPNEGMITVGPEANLDRLTSVAAGIGDEIAHDLTNAGGITDRHRDIDEVSPDLNAGGLLVACRRHDSRREIGQEHRRQ
jgi:hypothetical protein